MKTDLTKVFICTAMVEEYRALLSYCKDYNLSYEERPNYELHRNILTIRTDDYLIQATYIGISYFSAGILAKCLDIYKPHYLLNIGTCATLVNAPIGTTYLSDNFRCADLDMTMFSYPDGTHYKDRVQPIFPDVMISGSHFITSKEEMDLIKKRFPGAVTFDMESYMIDSIAYDYKIPFIAVKVVSDGGDESEFSSNVTKVTYLAVARAFSFLFENKKEDSYNML